MAFLAAMTTGSALGSVTLASSASSSSTEGSSALGFATIASSTSTSPAMGSGSPLGSFTSTSGLASSMGTGSVFGPSFNFSTSPSSSAFGAVPSAASSSNSSTMRTGSASGFAAFASPTSPFSVTGAGSALGSVTFASLFSSTSSMSTGSALGSSFTFASSTSTSSMRTGSAGSFNLGSSDNSSTFRSRKIYSIGKKGCKCRASSSPQMSSSDVSAPAEEAPGCNTFDGKLSTSFSTVTTTVLPNGLFANVTTAASSSSPLVSSDTKLNPDGIVPDGLFPNFTTAASSSSSVVSSDTKLNRDGIVPNGLFPNVTTAASSSSSVVSSDEIKQNEATGKANKEPLSNSSLPLTMVSRILNGLPQNPHFYQLRNYSYLTRKNLIFAWDQVFEETVKEIQSLQAINFWVRAEKLWKTMEELQNVGYNVIPLRRRLVEFTDVMVELKLTETSIKRLKIKAENHRMDKSRLESLIVSLRVMANREEDNMKSKLIEAAKLEDELLKFGAAFAKLGLQPL